MKLSDYVVRFIASLGVRHVFFVPGGGAMHLNDSLGRCQDIEPVSNHHEQASAIAAEAYARVTNNLGVAMVTSGPGGTNTITGVAAAWLDSTPCLFVSGQVKRADLKTNSGVRQLGVQESDIVAMVAPITKYAATVMDPCRIRYHLEKAVFLAKSGRPGPAWIDIPLDVQAAEIEPDSLEGYRSRRAGTMRPADLKERVRTAIELLNAAERPVLLVGNGVRLAGAADDLRELLGRVDLPVLTTRLGVDLVPAAHDKLVGMPGTIAPRGANFALQNSDWLLMLGARVDLALTAFAPGRFARAAKKIMVNVDRAEIDKLGSAIDVPVVADAQRFIREMLRQFENVHAKDRSAWISRCREWRSTYPFVLPEHRADPRGLSVYAFSEILCDELTGKDIVLPGNSGFGSEIFLTAFRVKAGQRVFHNKGTGAMGFSQPAAVGACLAGGTRRTVCVDGDGGFQMNIQELETIGRLNLPVKFFVVNNRGYASIRASQQSHFGRLTGADSSSGLTLPDPVKVAAAYGLGTARISKYEHLRPRIRAVLDAEGPVVCEVVTIPDEVRAPRVSSIIRSDGSMVSKPLEDMWPFLDRDEFRSNMIVPVIEE